MEKNEIFKNFLAGIFFLAGIALIAFVIFMLGKDKGMTQAKFPVTVLYRNVGGLLEGAPVRLAGVVVGNVAHIDFLERQVQQRRVKVVMNIFSRHKRQFDQDAHFAIKTEGVLGEKLVEITIIEADQPMDLSQPIMGGEPLDVESLVEAFAGAADSFTEVSEDLSSIDMQRLSQVMSETAQSLSSTSKGINMMLEEFRYITRKSKRLLNRVEQKIIDGSLFKVF